MTGARRPSLVFVARFVPVPARSGAPIRTHRLVTGLAGRFDVTLVAPAGEVGAARSATAQEIADALPGVALVLVPPRALRAGKRVHQLAGLAGRRSWEFGRYATPALRDAAVAAAQARSASVVHFDDPGAALAGPIRGPANVFAPHNVEHEIHRAVARSSTGARRAFAALEARRVLAEEQRAWRWADLCVAVSEADARAMRDGGARRVVVAPNGTDLVPPRPARPVPPGSPLRLLFVGSTYLPNVLGVRWLVEEVLPRLAGRLDVVVDVVGLPPAQVPAAPGVRAHGRVRSVAPFYAAADAAVVPLHQGSGTRLKVVEAMAHGVPVVSTRLGAAGLGLTAGVDHLAADDPAAFAAALVRLAADLRDRPQRVEALRAAARRAAEALSWPRVAGALADVYGELASSRPAAQTSGARTRARTSRPRTSSPGTTAV